MAGPAAPRINARSAYPRPTPDQGEQGAERFDHSGGDLASSGEHDSIDSPPRDPPSTTGFLYLLVGLGILTVAALIAGASGSPSFSVGLSIGVGVGAVPYLLFVAAQLGWSYSGEQRDRRRKLTDEERQQVFRRRYGPRAAAGDFARRNVGSDWQTHSEATGASADPWPELTRAFGLLGVSREASLREVTTAYHRLAHRHHPDKAGADSDEALKLAERHMKALNAAYTLIRQSVRNDAGSAAGESGS